MSLGNKFCSTPFWNSSLTWYTDDPDFTPCFERTALVYVPCLVLWLLSPLELYYIYLSKCRDIPWGFLNITKLILNLVLVALSLISFIWSICQLTTDSSTKVYPVEIYTPLIQILTFLLALVFLLWNKLRGIQTSCSLFIFYFLLTLSGIPQFRTEIRAEVDGKSDNGTFNFVIYMIYFPVVALSFAFNFVADQEPDVTNYPKSKKVCPEVQASFFSRLTFHWLNSLVWKGFRQPLTDETLFDVRFQDTSSQLVPRWEKCLHQMNEKNASKTNGYYVPNGTTKNTRSRKNKQISVLKLIFKTFWIDFLAGAVFKIVSDLASFINPQVLSLLITFVSDSSQPMWWGIIYAAVLFVAGEAYTFFYHHNLITMATLAINIRTVLTSSIYKKALTISSTARKESTVGEIANLMSVDAQRFIDFYPFINLVISGPLIIILAVVFLWQILGPSSLAGLAVMIVLVPINVYVANKVKFLQVKQMRFKDERIRLMNEVLSGVKVLKLYGWEPSFEEQILNIRNKEVKVLRKAALLNASTNFLWICSSYLVSLASIGVFVMVDDANVLTANIAFVATALFNVMKSPITTFPMAIQLLVQTIVSMKRIDRYLNAEELDLSSVSHDESRKELLIIENGTFSWGTGETDLPVLRNINFTVQPGSLVAVVGAVGSGKSSLISAFLGEMDKISGYINTKGQLAYVPQQAWIQNATVKDNILFGSPFDAKKYNKIIAACALKPDLEMLPAGDQTEIGEKGINLSGGQKQRVSLARAVYSDCETYLFDDPLSAVDSHVGKHIFENVIGPTGILSKKTRVLVTHGVVFLPKVDHIVVLKGGQITESGTFKELLAKKGEFSDFLVEHITGTIDEELDLEIEEIMDENPELKVQVFRRMSSTDASFKSTASKGSRKRHGSVSSNNPEEPVTKEQPRDQLIVTERAETGGVKWSVYLAYLKTVGLLMSLATLGFQVLYQACSILSSSWLSTWTDDSSYINSDGTQNEAKREFYLGIYGAYGLGQLLMNWVSSFALAYGTVYASKGMHIAMLTKILRAPMSFFDTTPTGRIVNRFGKDIDVIDNTLPFNLSTALNCFILVGGAVIVIICSTPIFAAVIVPVGLLYYILQKFYIATSRQTKRLESVSRSPIYSHFTETVTGAASIRAYRAEERFIATSESRVDYNTRSLYPNQVSKRWLGIRLETIGNILIFFAALFAVLERNSIDAGTVGLSISYALQITSMLNIAVRMASEIETNVVSVERITEYTDVPQEAAWIVEPRPEPRWPDRGTVSFEDYQVRYREGLDLVLRGISFTVEGGEKIGIVGRTGAGKSSLTLCLFRIIEAAGGHIYIDDIDIARIGLGDLRSKLTIIPQDPVLFSGSLRLNLDPFEMYEDSSIWQALELAHLSEYARSLPSGLSHTITEGGENVSVGQRQLICLARALLRKTKVLILDEATAAIDLETDDLIQQTIRKEFRDCTVLTIAHRLNTIMDSDRVLVLDQGRIKEFDSPSSLLKEPSTIFYGMAKDAGLVH